MVIVLADRAHVPHPSDPHQHVAWRLLRPSTASDLVELLSRVDHLLATCAHNLDSLMTSSLSVASTQLREAIANGGAFHAQRLEKLREQQAQAKRALETAVASEHELLETLARMARP